MMRMSDADRDRLDAAVAEMNTLFVELKARYEGDYDLRAYVRVREDEPMELNVSLTRLEYTSR